MHFRLVDSREPGEAVGVGQRPKRRPPARESRLPRAARSAEEDAQDQATADPADDGGLQRPAEQVVGVPMVEVEGETGIAEPPDGARDPARAREELQVRLPRLTPCPAKGTSEVSPDESKSLGIAQRCRARRFRTRRPAIGGPPRTMLPAKSFNIAVPNRTTSAGSLFTCICILVAFP